MAYTNFKQTFWSKHIQRELAKKAILADFCNKEFTGEAKQGNTVKIVGVGKPTIGDYTGADIGAPEHVADTTQSLVIDKAKFFNFGVDDVDKVQTVPGLMEALMEEASEAMALEVDTAIAALAAGATNASATTLINTAALAKTAVDAGLLALRENNVAAGAEIVIEIPHFVYALLRDKYIELSTANADMLAKGIVGTYDGAMVRPTNNLYNDLTDFYCMIRTKKAIAYVNQIDKVEPFRPQGLFEDAIKGLNVFGAKIVRQEQLYVIKAHK